MISPHENSQAKFSEKSFRRSARNALNDDECLCLEELLCQFMLCPKLSRQRRSRILRARSASVIGRARARVETPPRAPKSPADAETARTE